MDSQVSWLSYVAQSYLVSGKIPKRIGNDHPSIVPYQTVMAKDGLMVLAIANDRQFRDFCKFAKLINLYENPKFSTNSSRVLNRNELNRILNEVVKKKTIVEWVNGLVKVNVPCGPINDLKKVFKDPQVKARGMKFSIKHKKAKKKIDLIANPIKFSVSKIKYKKAPPVLGEDTDIILKQFLKLDSKKIKSLKKNKII